ncbi:lipopolysaccharide biosynthesis protein [Fibrobacter sp. UWEL]|uniref:lipopolysaccharide biosynthesis protein n=1 Tax=Fibrobacter sp. UWEL TaxID=1896209 RepID=UPI0009146C05|nr:lipopolysaccharide biosynthesis protein [Fibrobacter sp. UWEL]SHL44272.1 Capsule polysaccharide export protein KpsE/RkpR [Fibrobacter sp. UWEL]
MEKQASAGFIEIILRVMNNCLRRFKLWLFILLFPTIVAFVLVMWVIKPVYAAVAVVTPPAASQSALSGLSSMLGGASGSVSSLLGLGTADEDANAVWTIINSWELHNQVIEKFNLAEHYEFDGKFHADLLKQFRQSFGVEVNKEDMFAISMEDEDYKLAAQMVRFILEKTDSAFNAFKTSQARQSRLYFQSRLDSCTHTLDSLIDDFVKFQEENNIYDPEVQLESTLKYLSTLQSRREEVSMEMAFEKADRGEGSRRYDELNKRYKGVNTALNGAVNGKHKDLGLVSLKKSPELGAEYVRRETEIRVQEAMYKLLRQQSEQMRMEEAKMLTNLHVLEPPWENDKKIYPLRGVTLMFTFMVSFIFATIICNILGYLEDEETRDSETARQWKAFKGHFSRKKA